MKSWKLVWIGICCVLLWDGSSIPKWSRSLREVGDNFWWFRKKIKHQKASFSYFLTIQILPCRLVVPLFLLLAPPWSPELDGHCVYQQHGKIPEYWIGHIRSFQVILRQDRSFQVISGYDRYGQVCSILFKSV